MKTKTRNGLLAAGACCALAAPGAHAQSSVTLYGIIDTGVEYVSHANAAGDHLVRMPGVTGELPSRWGCAAPRISAAATRRCSRSKAASTCAAAISARRSAVRRQAFVGLKSGFGTLAFGRQYTMTYLALQGADIIGPDIYAGSFDAYVPNGRADNAVTYVGAYRGVTFGAAYSFGRDGAGTGNSPGQGTCAGQVPGDAVQCRNWSVMLKYDSAYFGAAASYEEQRGGTGAAANFFDGVAPVPFTSSGGKDARTHVSAYAQAAGAKIGAGWIGRRVSTGSPAAPGAHSDLFFVGASYAVKPDFVVDGEGYRIVNSAHDTRATMATLRATYLLTKRTAVYAQSSYLWNSAHARYSVSGGVRHDTRRRDGAARRDGRRAAHVLIHRRDEPNGSYLEQEICIPLYCAAVRRRDARRLRRRRFGEFRTDAPERRDTGRDGADLRRARREARVCEHVVHVGDDRGCRRAHGGRQADRRALRDRREDERARGPVDGKTYAIGFEMRLPKAWNGRFFYQANGGLDGNVVTATGEIGGGGPLTDALNQASR